MAFPTETSDDAILDLLRQSGPMRVSELASATSVTATAVRQRLTRMMERGLVDREASPAGRGRPSHRYGLTDKGQRQTGDNFSDLALVLWQEVRAIDDPEIRKGLLKRVAGHMASLYADRVQGATAGERMQEVAQVFAERSVPVRVETATPATVACGADGAMAGEASSGPAVLNVLACPYPQLAEQDRGICALERMMFAELIEHDVKLVACRLDGDPCCRFQTN